MPASSHAAELTLTPRGQLARPGQLIQLRLTAPAASSCQLRVDTRRLRVTTTGAGAFVMSARVSRRARAGAHSLSLRCSEQRTRTRISVARSAANRKARGTLFRGRLRITAVQQASASDGPAASTVAVSAAPFPRPILTASAQARVWWQSYGSAVVASFRNGECTDWAQRRRPDIVHSAYMRRYDRYGSNGTITSWDAKYWTQHALEAGLPVGRSAVVGAIMVSAPGSYGAGSSGHVAVVESVASNGSFEITAMHAPNIGTVTRRTYSAAAAAAMRTDPGLAFIL
ncbi:MAG: CHAP domain-containing protein [Actinomycetota bacterium]|nr:CHAP domain-containing protein [Actinomycetota bacterium]